jgi:hypothetical protein
MASLRPSAYNQQERADGGPFLVIASAEPEDDSVNVFHGHCPRTAQT